MVCPRHAQCHPSAFDDELEPLQQLLTYLADKQLLLVLDNFEHLLKGASIVPVLLARAPGAEACSNKRCSASKSPHQ